MEGRFMLRALELAAKGRGFTSPNPCVGAVIVRNGEILAEGWHEKAGKDHAEAVAIKNFISSGEEVLGDEVIYVTLEPCAHVGRTGACAKYIVDTGFKHVVVGMLDPYEKVNGKGVEILRDAGVAVEILDVNSPILSKLELLNSDFLKGCWVGLPYVVMKAGMSLDGKIATHAGESKWITGEESLADARLERSIADAVLVGRGTVEVDNPTLAAHGMYEEKTLLRVVIDSDLRLDLDSKIFRDKDVLVVHREGVDEGRLKSFAAKGLKLFSFPGERLEVQELLKKLFEMGVRRLFVEGGSEVHGAFFDASMENLEVLDEVLFYVAPILIGGKEALPVIGGKGCTKLTDALRFSDVKVESVGCDLKIRGFLG